MKIAVWITDVGCDEAQDDEACVCAQYFCGDRSFSSSVLTHVDLNLTEDQIKDAIRTSVSNDVNTKRGLSTTAADVRLI
jgi:hypothetical protein